jgi:ATP synthase F1 complex assembly factor 1
MFSRMIHRSHFTYPIPKQLNEVARLPLLQQESPIKIRQLWLEQFKDRNDVVVGTMALKEFEQFRANAKECPMFLVPVMKTESSFFNLVSQFQDGKHCLLTSVNAYRENPGAASPMMVITIYDELVKEKGIALVRGDLVNQLDLGKQDGEIILKFLREFYLNNFKLISDFNKNSREFEFNDLLQKFREFRLNCQN